MENLETPLNPQPEPTDLQEQYESLRHLVVSALVLLLIVSGTFDVFLLRQVRFTNTDLGQARTQAQQLMVEYNKVSGPVVQDFVKKLVDYGKKNPDFAPIINKYHLGEVAKAPPGPAPAKKQDAAK